MKTVSIHRTWKRVFNLTPTADHDFPVQILCDTQTQNDRRQVVLSSIVRIFNQTTMPLSLLKIDSSPNKQHEKIVRIDINQDYYIPIDFLYATDHSSIAFGVEE